MLKIATVFSGIGAIEHALKRMDIPFEIEFACDNGDVDIFTKKIENDLEIIELELLEINIKINEFLELKNEYDTIKKSFSSSFTKAEQINNATFIKNVIVISEFIIDNTNNNNKKKEIIKTYDQIKKKNDVYSFYRSMLLFKKIFNYFKKNNSIKIHELNTLQSSFTDNVNWMDVRKEMMYCSNFIDNPNCINLLNALREIKERLSMLYEKVEINEVRKVLCSIKDPNLKKEYVDNLYKPYRKQNKVMQSYFANYAITEDKFYWNVSFLDGTPYKNKIDLFVGGSPCQSFSLVGKQRGLEDTRGTLFYDFARLIQEINPKVFIYENVKAVLSNDNGRTWKVMQSVFNELKYKFYPMILNSKDYGIPQNRERLFVVGFRNDLNLEKDFNEPTKIELKKTMKDFLIENVSGKYYLNHKGVNFVTDEKNLLKRFTQIDGDVQLCQKKNQQFNWHGDFVFVEENKNREKVMQDLEKYFLSDKVVKYVLSTGTKGFYSKPKVDLDIARPLLTSMHKMHRAGIDNYVTTDGRLRKLTPRECLRLMGFCDSFCIVVSDTAMYQQAGNSIVVDVLIKIMESIFDTYPLLLGGG